MRHVLLILFTLFCLLKMISQETITKDELVEHFGFEQKSISRDGRDIVYYTYQKDNSKKDKLVLYLQGSDPSPLFSYQKDENGFRENCFIKGDYKTLGDEYLYVAIEKIGFEDLIDENNIPTPIIYQKNNSLHNRVHRANEVINHLEEKHHFSKVIVYGHSEGAPVAAKLATQNNKITHLGFWAGNVLPDFFDFMLEARREYYQGKANIQETHQQISQTIEGFVNHIAKDTANFDEEGYTNLRWWSYAEPPINNLIQLDIPLYVQVATEDTNAPIESAYLLPLEFARLKKSNLTFNVCIGCDHSFRRKNKEESMERLWPLIFENFIKWTNE